MKTILKILFITGAIMLTLSCTREPAVLDDFDVTPSATDIYAGTAIDYTITGKADFITFYSGAEGSKYENYPEDKGVSVSIKNSNIYSKAYNKHGSVTSTFVASSYGNWGEDEKTVIKEFKITVTDNRTGITALKVITGTLLKQKEWPGVVNQDNKTVVVTVDPGTGVTSAKVGISLQSQDAVILANGAAFVNNNTKLNLTSPVVFTITAPDGSSADWTLSVVGY